MSTADYSLTDNVSGMAYTTNQAGTLLKKLMLQQSICFLTQKLIPGESVIAMLGAVLDQAKEHNVTVFTGTPIDQVLLDNSHGRTLDIRTEPDWGVKGVQGDTLAFVTPLKLQNITFKLAVDFHEQKPNNPIFMEAFSIQDYLYTLRMYFSLTTGKRQEVLKDLYTKTIFIDVERLCTKPMQGVLKPKWHTILSG